MSKIEIFGSRTFTATFGQKNGAESQKNISGPLGRGAQSRIILAPSPVPITLGHISLVTLVTVLENR